MLWVLEEGLTLRSPREKELPRAEKFHSTRALN